MVFKKDINPFVVTDAAYDARYLLGIVNSRLMSYLYIRNSAIAAKNDFRQTTLAELRRLAIPRVDVVGPEKADRLIAHVKTMLSVRKQQATARHPQEIERLRREIDSRDRQIDQLVYQLYGLTDAEITGRGGDGAGVENLTSGGASSTMYPDQRME